MRVFLNLLNKTFERNTIPTTEMGTGTPVHSHLKSDTNDIQYLKPDTFAVHSALSLPPK